LTVVEVFDLGRWSLADLAVQATMVEPVDVLEGGELQLIEGAPGPAPSDQLALVEPDGRFGDRVVDRIADRSHRWCRTDLSQALGETNGRELTAGVV